MKSKQRRKANNTIFVAILTIAVVVWTIINIVNVFKVMKNAERLESGKSTNTVSNNITIQNVVTAEDIEENTNQLEIEDLQDKDERTRMQQYCGKFIRYIEEKDYDKAYALLYPDFKNNYFPTEEDFAKYAQEKFPSSLITVEYNNIERQGQYYILFTTVKTPLDSSYSMDQKFILIENGFNDFQISFDVKQD